ncbi:hypothetical protein GCM10010517_72380 [Streptosporangium fragile]|uniref:Glyoxalase-like domain-containing protein n=1 Tax=Streptosporangium fragile TaxID=46186 RepID=A0ABP6IR80_9ACTN
MRVDHVIMGARSIEPLRELLWERYGFGVTDGSPNPDGTASWVVPFDTDDVQYLELLVPHDEAALTAGEFGRVFLERTADGPAFLNWAALADDIEAAAERVRAVLGADPELIRGESVRADGCRVPWAEAAFAASWAVPSRPFFLEYGDWPARRARVPGDLAAAGHRTTPTAITAVVVGTGLGDWPGSDELPVEVLPGGDGIREIRVATAGGEVSVSLP